MLPLCPFIDEDGDWFSLALPLPETDRRVRITLEDDDYIYTVLDRSGSALYHTPDPSDAIDYAVRYAIACWETAEALFAQEWARMEAFGAAINAARMHGSQARFKPSEPMGSLLVKQGKCLHLACYDSDGKWEGCSFGGETAS